MRNVMNDLISSDMLPLSEVPPLEMGDSLSRPEFERRYEAMPHLKKAELIEGVVFVEPHVEVWHGAAHSHLIAWLGTYTAYTPTTECLNNASLRMDMFNEAQPDAILRVPDSGQTRIGKDKPYLEGAPELIGEVAANHVNLELHAKRRLYHRHGVREYVVWRVHDEDWDWFRLEDGEYQRLLPDADGVIRSREYPGLWLDKAALLRDDMKQVLAVLSQGIASPEHAAFVARLAATKTS